MFASVFTLTGEAAIAEESLPAETVDNAWWTGPLLAANASTLPQGHFYVEPYLYDLVPYARFDSSGHAHDVVHQSEWGSLTYLNYGLADQVTIGAIPRFGYHEISGAPSSAGVQAGDLTLQAQYRLTQFRPGGYTPTISLNVQQTLPTGNYDRLERASDGLGAGAYTRTLSIYSQTYLWTPNGRILRARLDLSFAFPSRVDLQGASVYGTGVGFNGYALAGNSAYADMAFEYSITRNWVAALDLWYERDGDTRVFRNYLSSSNQTSVTALVGASGAGRELIVAPAIEYNWSARLGVIVGMRLTATGSNETGGMAAVVALSYFY